MVAESVQPKVSVGFHYVRLAGSHVGQDVRDKSAGRYDGLALLRDMGREVCRGLRRGLGDRPGGTELEDALGLDKAQRDEAVIGGAAVLHERRGNGRGSGGAPPAQAAALSDR